MNIWIIRNGEKAGPYQDYEIRSMIECGEIDGSTPAWHENLDGWKPLGEHGLFDHALKPKPSEPPVAPAPPPIPTPKPNPYLLRRFWARWLDLYLFSGIWWLTMWACHLDIGALFVNPWTIPFHYAPWFALEAFLIHRFATTPGKWMLGIKVLNLDGSRLSPRASFIRAARVFFIGIGFGVQLLNLVCQLVAWITTRNLGSTLWDRAGGHKLDAGQLHPASIPVYTIALFFAIWLNMIVLFPHIIEATRDTQPEIHEQLKQNPTWHLPARGQHPVDP